MVRKKLFCAIVGVAGDAFDVEIDDHASIFTLKEKIKGMDPNTIQCDAKDLQLFLAKKGDAWLQYDDPAVLALKEGYTHQDIQNSIDGEKMQATWTIEDVLLANNMTEPKSKQIHVLVVVPEGGRRSANETSALGEMIKEIHAETVLGKRTFSLSQMDISDWTDITNELNILVCTIDTVGIAAGEGTPIDPFDWAHTIQADHEVTLGEEQRKPYLEYMERNIGDVLTKKKLCVLDVEKESSLLDVNVPGRTRDIELSGTTDLLILRDTVKKDPSCVPLLLGVQMLVEVKEKVESRTNFQALSELVALDLCTHDPVMALLTDLNESWVFFWVAEKENDSVLIHRAFIDNPSEGFRVIRTILEKSSTDIDAEFELQYFERPVKRLKLRSALRTVTGGSESGVIRDCIERYYDIASLLGPDEDMAREVASQVVRSIPAFSHFS